jgi:transposase
MIRSGTIIMIREKISQGKTDYAIGKELNISKNTVKKYRDSPVSQHALKGSKRPSKLDPFKPEIGMLLNRGIYNCQVIFEHIKEQGYTGKITILKDYVKQFRPAKIAPAARRYESLPGQQAQMDWGICSYIDENRITHKVPAFAMIMGSSRAKYIEFTKRCDIYSLMRCMVNAFEYFGGVPKVVLTDRMKTVLIGMEAGNPLWNKRFEEFAADIGFIPKVCRPRRPQTKGKVERLVEYVKDNFLPGRQFKDIDDLNHQALEWCTRVDSKPHGTTGDIPLKALSEEPLLNLPAKEILYKYRWEARKVTIDGFISYDGIRYGVPWQFSRKEVRVRVLQDNLEIYDGEVLITSHKLEYTSGKIKWLKGQYQGLTEKNGYAIYPPYARQINICAVETRPLHIYDAVMGVIQNA